MFILSLTSLAHSGDALARLPDGRACFVPFGLPGETVRVQIVDETTRFARAEIVEIITPSPGRITPRCAHFGGCGGCQFQHISYEKQLEVKTNLVWEALVNVGQLENPPLHAIVPSPSPWNYRNHVQFGLTSEGGLGYHAAKSETVIPIRGCHLPEDVLNELWPLLDLEIIPDLERISLRVGSDGDALLTFEGSDPAPPEFEIDFPLSSVYLHPEGEPVILSGNDHVIAEVSGRAFRVSAGAFFQVNTPVAEKMVAHVLNLLPEKPGVVLDLYCGGGLFSAFLAERAVRLIGVESDPLACADFVENLDEFENVELYEAPVEAVLPGLGLKPDWVLSDPPRAGLGRSLAGIIALSPPVLVYVSCDPGSLARDAKKLLAGGYSLEQVTPFDMFPQTFHVESIAVFTRSAS